MNLIYLLQVSLLPDSPPSMHFHTAAPLPGLSHKPGGLFFCLKYIKESFIL